MANFTTAIDIDDTDPQSSAMLERILKDSTGARDQAATTQQKDFESVKGKKEGRRIDVHDVDISKFVKEGIFKSDNIYQDNETLLRKIQERISNAGMESPTVEVRYQDLTVEARVHVGSRALPSLYNTILNFIDTILFSLNLSANGKNKLVILESVSGVLKPGRMTLLLGPPSSGKTTLLQALAGQSDATLKIDGEITYNGYNFDEFQPRKTSGYVGQYDEHIPEFTVRETMEYAASFQGFDNQQELMSELLSREREGGIIPDPEIDIFMKALATKDIFHELVTEYFMKMLGLDICAETIVGDHMRKGLSGGQKKRLTTGEMIVGPSRVLFMDDISTGLDSSTTFQIIKCLGQFSSILRKTIMISLLQPDPETFGLFDDVILLISGQIAYHGPCQNVEQFFEFCGFKRPRRKGIADYLQEVTSIKDQKQYWADRRQPYRFVPAKEFAAAYKNFSAGQKMSRELSMPFERSKSHKQALSFSYFSLPASDLFKTTFRKELLYMKKTVLIEVAIVLQMLFTAAILGAMFFRTERGHNTLTDAQEYAGLLFMLYMVITLIGFGELTLFTVRFPTLVKYREKQFYPSWAWSLSVCLIKIPWGTIEASSCVAIVYYIADLAPSASRFFKLLLMMSAMVQMSAALFRMVAGLLRIPVLSSSIGGFVLIQLILFGGFVIPRSDIRGWWIWAYWALPMSYGQHGVVVNEFLDPRWRKPIFGTSQTLGHRFIRGLSLSDRGYWFWLAFGVEIGFAILYNILLSVFTTLIKPPSKSRAVISQSLLDEWEENRTGGPELGARRRSMSGSGRFRSLSQSGNGLMRDSSLGRVDRDRGSVRASQPMSSDPGNEISSSSPDEHEQRGMVLPFQPYGISFKNVNYYVDMPKEYRDRGATEDKLQLLHDVTGAFRPGVLTALVGVTGAGKSTLMDVLSGRKTRGYTEGDIRINGYPKRHETFTRIAAYCEQVDIHSPQLTVHESVTFSAWARLSPDINLETKEDFIEEVIDLVELDTLRDALVGVPLQSGLSIEQRKRLTVAVELVANPSIIFMDEPTSGLDARAAAAVMRAVRNTVDTGRTIVCTIHQPSIDIFESFDELLLLKRGGYVIYAGPLGTNSQHLIDYFQSNADVPPIKDEENPAAWMLEITQPGVERKLDVDFADIYRQSSAYRDMENLVDTLSTPPENAKDIEFSTEYALSLWDQYKLCLWKQNWTYWRSPGYNLMRILLSTALAISEGTLFWGYGRKLDTERNIYSYFGAVFITNVMYGILSCQAVQPLAAGERTVFYRERGARLYSELPYAFAQFTIEIPYILVASSLFQLIAYSMLRFPWNAGKFFWQLYFTFTSQITYVFLGLIAVSLTPSPEFANIASMFLLLTYGLLSGFALPLPRMNAWTKWLTWLNPTAYAVYGSIVSMIGDIDDEYLITRNNESLSLKSYLRVYYGFRHNLLPLVALVAPAFPLVFAIGYVYFIKKLNFQKR